jgi:predicted  nucleic acid-binding Zn-ribbon protein
VTPQNLSENRYNDYNSIREPAPDRILELQTRLREEEGRCESLQQEIDEKNLHIGTLERQLHEVQTHQIEAIDNNALSEPAQLESRYKMLRAVLLQYREKNMLLRDRLEASEARERDLRALLQRAQQDLENQNSGRVVTQNRLETADNSILRLENSVPGLNNHIDSGSERRGSATNLSDSQSVAQQSRSTRQGQRRDPNTHGYWLLKGRGYQSNGRPHYALSRPISRKHAYVYS